MDGKRVRFTRHTRRKLELLSELGVSESAVLRALEEPDEVLYDTLRDRLVAVRYDQRLAVPFDREGNALGHGDIQQRAPEAGREEEEVR